MRRTNDHPSRILMAIAVVVGAIVVAALAFGDLRALLDALTSRPSPEEREGIDG